MSWNRFVRMLLRFFERFFPRCNFFEYSCPFGLCLLLTVGNCEVKGYDFLTVLCLLVRTLMRDFRIILLGFLLLSILQAFCGPLLQVEAVRSLRRLMDIQTCLRVRNMLLFLLLIGIRLVLCLDDLFFDNFFGLPSDCTCKN